MTDAVIMACSILSLSRMSLINLVLLSVIILIPLITIRMYVPLFLSYFKLTEMSTYFDIRFT